MSTDLLVKTYPLTLAGLTAFADVYEKVKLAHQKFEMAGKYEASNSKISAKRLATEAKQLQQEVQQAYKYGSPEFQEALRDACRPFPNVKLVE